MRNITITAAPASLLAYHKLFLRFTADIGIKINGLDYFLSQGFGDITGLLLSKYPDYSGDVPVSIPLVNAGFSCEREDLRRRMVRARTRNQCHPKQDVHWWPEAGYTLY
jgi:hypothetical protein